ncbi:hypothetical protein BHUM_04863c [Candidatus Burkholderia humilis]|nr:hypothetical protein BHUM_04863c [Candidatus Burkholderia humilis]
MRNTISRAIVCSIGFVMLSGPGGIVYAQCAARASIEASNRRFEQAVSRSDAAGIAATYTESAKLLPANDHVVSGRQAVTRFWQNAIDSGLKSIKLTTVEVDARGDTAYEVGKWSVPGEAGKVYDAGDYVVIWKRVKGQWKQHRDIWTTNSPPPKR